MKLYSVKAREGSSLIIVTCVAAFLIAFALAMLYTASLSLSRANRRMEQERSYQLARSFSETLEQELTRYQYLPNSHQPVSGAPGYQADQIAPAAGGTFYQYVVKFLEGQYGEYDPEHPDETIFHFTAAEASGVDETAYGTIRTVLYKEAGADSEEMFGYLTAGQDLTDITTKSIQRYTFIVEVTAEADGVSFSYQTEYRQMVSYDVRFTYGPGRIPVVKDDSGVWRRGDASGDIMNFQDDTELQYEYLTGENNIKTCVFENIYQAESMNQTEGEDGT